VKETGDDGRWTPLERELVCRPAVRRQRKNAYLVGMLVAVLLVWPGPRAINGQPGQSTPAQNAPVNRSDEDLLILEMRLGRYLLSESIIGYIYAGGVLLSLQEFADALDFAVSVDQASGQATGWFLQPNRQFALDASRREVSVEGKLSLYDPKLVEVHPDGIYVDAALLAKWFPIEIKYDLSQLVLDISSKEMLPVEKRFERDRARERLHRGTAASPEYSRTVAPYRPVAWPFVEADAWLEQRRWGTVQRRAFRYSGLFSGDLLYMNSSAFFSGDDEDPLTTARVRLGRTDPDGEMLGPLKARSYSFGDILTPEIPLIARSSAGIGLDISNFPVNRATQFDRTTLQGELPLDWEVELYRNGALLDYRLSRADGRYEFPDVPLLFGLNILRLVFYGPQGQTREQVSRILVGPGMIRPGRSYYRIAANRQGDYLLPVKEDVFTSGADTRGRYFLKLEQGITQSMSVSMAGASLVFDGQRRYYSSIGLRTALLGTYSQFDINNQVDGGTALRLASQVIALGYNLSLEHYRLFDYSSEWTSRTSDPLTSISSFRLHGRVPLSLLPRASFGLDGRFERHESSRIDVRASNRLSMFIYGLSVAHTIGGSTSRGGGVETTTRFNGSLLVGGGRKPLTLHGQLNYEPSPELSFSDVALRAQYGDPSGLVMQFGVDQELLEDRQSRYTVGLVRRFDALSCGLEGMYENAELFSIRLSLSFSLSRQPHSGQWHMDAGRIGNCGAAEVRVFLDQNQDGRFSPGDEPLSNIRLRHNGLPATMTDANGLTFMTGLPAFMPSNITIDEGSIEDPYWMPAVDGISVVARPGAAARVEFPIVTTGEVDGMVYLDLKSSIKPASNVAMELADSSGTVVMTARTAFDGFYLFSRVPPGSYIVRVSPSQLRRLKLLAPAHRRIKIEGNATVISGVDFTLVQAVQRD
jgi:hypothetical protein